LAGRQRRHLPVFEVDDAICVVEEGDDVRGNIRRVVRDADDQR
jgi:hypothetical protein